MQISTVSVITRPFSTRAFHYMCERAFPDQRVRYASDWRGVEETWLMEPFYRVHRSSEPTDDLLARYGVSEPVVEDVVRRCRLLRALPPARARRMVAAMWHAAEEYVDAERPDLMIAVLLDCYVYDVLARVQTGRGRAFVTVADTLLPDYGEVNYRYLPFVVREPSDEEVEAVVARLRPKSFRPAYLTAPYFRDQKLYRFFRLYARHKARLAYFWLRRTVSGDPLNFHLNVVNGMVCARLDYLDTARFWHDDWRERIAAAGRPSVFVPLQFYPEARYDYSPLPPALADLPSLTIRLAEVLSGRYTVVVKEHPAAYGSRDPEFYRALAAFPNVVFVPTLVPSHEVTAVTDCVITPGGTVGLETAIRGGRVVTIGRTNYYTPEAMELIESEDDVRDLPELLAQRPPAYDPDARAAAVVRTLLSQLLPGGFPHINFDPANAADAEQMDRFARSFREHLPLIHARALELNRDDAVAPAGV